MRIKPTFFMKEIFYFYHMTYNWQKVLKNPPRLANIKKGKMIYLCITYIS